MESNKDIPIRKSWGQNFIIDKNTINKIIKIINPIKDEHLIEIGPGKGALTFPISPLVKKITCIEIDPLLCKYLDSDKKNNTKIINDDFLKYELNCKPNQRVIGNLPYYISSPIIFKLLQIPNISEIIIMVQKELGVRICSKPNSKDYSRLSVLCQAFCSVKFECNISRNIFNPKPKVDSCIIKLKRKKFDLDINNFSKFIREAFKHRRKKIKNNLINYLLDNNIAEKRPEDITVLQYIEIYNKNFF